MIPLIVCGAHGRMGQAIIELAHNSPDFKVVAGVVRSKNGNTSPFPLYSDLQSALRHHHEPRPVILDFSVAEGAPENLRAALDFGCGILIGTTGHPPNHFELFNQAQKTIPLVVAPNTSLIAVLMRQLCSIAADILPQSHKAILDIHHAEKRDAPSGTAKALSVAMREDVSIKSLRLGKIAGEHSAYFVNDFEQLEITHRVLDRMVFAQGALVAAQFIFTHGPGLYDMSDVLNLNIDDKNKPRS